MAKGVEDTAFYRYGRLLAHNEVGGDPARFSIAASTFHAANAARAAEYPQGLLTTMTHDAKRSADARARITALTHLAGEWAAIVRELVPRGDGADPVERYFILQTLAGVHPVEAERLDGYLTKALREAKRRTSWVAPDFEHERRVIAYARELLADPLFSQRFEPFVSKLTVLGRQISLAWLALKLTSPGVPDTYQGDELEFLAFVDPDNRRPVDFDRRRALLRDRCQSQAKLTLLQQLLSLRKRRPEAFAPGASYEPIDSGAGTCSYLRGGAVLVSVAFPHAGTTPAAPPRDNSSWQQITTGTAGVVVYERT
jgi:(1->4)-alpha-D-glucan 1-alpha-D-glucosylmutase